MRTEADLHSKFDGVEKLTKLKILHPKMLILTLNKL